MSRPMLFVAPATLLLLAACSGSPSPVASAAPVAPPPPAPAPVAAAKPSVESLTIAFSNASTKLSPSALQQLDGAARLYRDAHPEVMIVTGHTDRSGDEMRNIMLSARRAEAVKRALAARGIPTDKLQIVAMGEAEPVPGVSPDKVAVVTWR